MKPTLSAFVSLSAMVLLVALGAGCSLVTVSSDANYRDQEGTFSGGLIEAIQPGVTTHDWLLKHFGEPAHAITMGVGEQLYTWPFLFETHSRRRVFLLFDSRKSHRDSRFLHAHIDAQQRVVAAWVDQHLQVPQAIVKPVVGTERLAPAFMSDASLLSVSPKDTGKAAAGEAAAVPTTTGPTAPPIIHDADATETSSPAPVTSP